MRMPIKADFRSLNLSNSGRAVWLVKVPKYINSRWEDVKEDVELGILQISKLPGRKPQLSLSLSDQVLALGTDSIPKTYKLAVSVVVKETIGFFSCNQDTSADEQRSDSQKLSLEGKIVQKLECQVNADKMYMDMKTESIRLACIPKQKVQSLEKAVNNFKPISDHKHNVSSYYNNFQFHLLTLSFSLRLNTTTR